MSVANPGVIRDKSPFQKFPLLSSHLEFRISLLVLKIQGAAPDPFQHITRSTQPNNNHAPLLENPQSDSDYPWRLCNQHGRGHCRYSQSMDKTKGIQIKQPNSKTSKHLSLLTIFHSLYKQEIVVDILKVWTRRLSQHSKLTFSFLSSRALRFSLRLSSGLRTDEVVVRG